MKQTTNTKKLALAGVLTALAIVGSFLSFPVAGSKCAPVQHMVNIFAAVLLGPGWGVGIAFCASLLRNILGIGSLMAFPGSMIGALCCGLVYKKCKNLSLTCLARSTWNRYSRRNCCLSGCFIPYGSSTCRIIYLCDPIPDLNSSRKYPGIPADFSIPEKWSNGTAFSDFLIRNCKISEQLHAIHWGHHLVPHKKMQNQSVITGVFR